MSNQKVENTTNLQRSQTAFNLKKKKHLIKSENNGIEEMELFPIINY